MTDSSNISSSDFQQLIAGLQSIADGNYNERLDYELEGDSARELQTALNAAIQSLDDHLGEDREATMSMALGLSECFGVMASVRKGDLTARVSDEMLSSENELMSRFGGSLNDTIADIQQQIATISRQQDTQAAMEHLVRQLQTRSLSSGMTCWAFRSSAWSTAVAVSR